VFWFCVVFSWSSVLSSCLVLCCPSINNRMNRQFLQQFRALRNRVDITQTQERVHRKDNSARFKEMERWMDKNLTGEGVGSNASEAKKAAQQRLAQQDGQQEAKTNKTQKCIPFPVKRALR
jgi:hypothetical protein